MDRIINFFPEDRRGQLLMDLSLNLKGVVAQQLIPTPDGKGRAWRWKSCSAPAGAGLHPRRRDPQAQGSDEGLRAAGHEDLRPEPVRAVPGRRDQLRGRAALRRLAERGAPAHQAGPGRRRADPGAGGWMASRSRNCAEPRPHRTESRASPGFFHPRLRWPLWAVACVLSGKGYPGLRQGVSMRLPISAAAVAGIALAFGLSAQVHAATQARTTQVPASVACQLSIPTVDTAVRAKATGFRNEGTASTYVICGLQDPVEGAVTDAGIAFYALDNKPHTFDCTGVNGWPDSGSYGYPPRASRQAHRRSGRRCISCPRISAGPPTCRTRGISR